MKNFDKYLKFATQRIPGILLLFFLLLAFVGPLYAPVLYWTFVFLFHIFLCTNAIRMAVGLVITAIKTKKHTAINWANKYKQFLTGEKFEEEPLRMEDVRHVIIIPNYKEDLETLAETLETLACHYQAASVYKVILAMEEGEKGCEEKAEFLIKNFGYRFLSLKYTVHPKDIPGEARGKSSNVAWASRYYAEHWTTEAQDPYECVTVMDADTQLSSKYFECLSFKYCIGTSEERKRMLFSPTLIFDRNANQVPFVVRFADICWSIGLMANFQLPVKFPCSVYTVSMILARQVGFWDAGPEAIGEDMHMSIKCWTRTKMNLIAIPIYIPASCSNVQGKSYLDSIKARFQQSKRHLWGSLDFGYSIAEVILQNCWQKNLLKSMLCVYLLFEIIFQAYFGFFHLPGQLIYPQSIYGFGSFVFEYTTYIRMALIPPALVVCFAYEHYHYLACCYRLSILEEIQKNKSLHGLDLEDKDQMIPITVEPEYKKVAFRNWYHMLDYAAFPFCLFVYYLIPGTNAMIRQLFTNKLDYKVAAKPQAQTKLQMDEKTFVSGLEVMEESEREQLKAEEEGEGIYLRTKVTELTI